MSDNGADNGGAGERPQRTGRARGVYTSAQTRGMDAYTRGRDWVEGRDPATRTGATIGWFKRYRAADGQLYAVLLTAYFFLTMIPLILVETTYVYKDPEAFATRLERRLKLSGTTSHLLVDGARGLGRPQALGDADRHRQPLLLRCRLRTRAAARPLPGPGGSTCARERCSTRACTTGSSSSWH